MRPDALDQDRHLIGDEAHVSRGWAEHGQAASLAGRGHEQEEVVHLDDGLANAAAAEVLAGAPRQALEACRHGGQVLGVLAGESLRGPDGEAVAGQDEGLVDLVDPGDEIVKEPAQVGFGTGAWTGQPLRVAHVVPSGQSSVRCVLAPAPPPSIQLAAESAVMPVSAACPGAPAPSSTGPSSTDATASVPAAAPRPAGAPGPVPGSGVPSPLPPAGSKTDLPRSQPRWMADMVARVSSGDRSCSAADHSVGGGSASTPRSAEGPGRPGLSRSCGARLAWRTRRGSPSSRSARSAPAVSSAVAGITLPGPLPPSGCRGENSVGRPVV